MVMIVVIWSGGSGVSVSSCNSFNEEMVAFLIACFVFFFRRLGTYFGRAYRRGLFLILAMNHIQIVSRFGTMRTLLRPQRSRRLSASLRWFDRIADSSSCHRGLTLLYWSFTRFT